MATGTVMHAGKARQDARTPGCTSSHHSAAVSERSAHLALRAWLEALTWPELGYSKTLHSMLEALHKLENPSASAKTKGQRRRARKVEISPNKEGLEDSDFDLYDEGEVEAPDKKRTKRNTSRSHACKREKEDASRTAGGAADLDESLEPSGAVEDTEEDKKPAKKSVAGRFSRRKNIPSRTFQNPTEQTAVADARDLQAQATERRVIAAQDAEMHEVGPARKPKTAAVCFPHPSGSGHSIKQRTRYEYLTPCQKHPCNSIHLFVAVEKTFAETYLTVVLLLNTFGASNATKQATESPNLPRIACHTANGTSNRLLELRNSTTWQLN
jgi:hypothetical protein